MVNPESSKTSQTSHKIYSEQECKLIEDASMCQVCLFKHVGNEEHVHLYLLINPSSNHPFSVTILLPNRQCTKHLVYPRFLTKGASLGLSGLLHLSRDFTGDSYCLQNEDASQQGDLILTSESPHNLSTFDPRHLKVEKSNVCLAPSSFLLWWFFLMYDIFSYQGVRFFFPWKTLGI